MKEITRKELEVFLQNHKMWLKDKEDGRKADLHGANLYGADLHGADLRGADLHDADLCCINLHGANLYGADLRGADLRGANLRGADLRDADLYAADLRGANLRGANLRGADLRGANLCGANLCGADLRGANLYYPIACPEKGTFIAFKKAHNYIVELLVSEDAKRCSATGRKCRCSKAVVLSITKKDGSDSGLTEVASDYDSSFVYRVGETVEVPNFCEDRWDECSEGIHFFITRKEAEDYR